MLLHKHILWNYNCWSLFIERTNKLPLFPSIQRSAVSPHFRTTYDPCKANLVFDSTHTVPSNLSNMWTNTVGCAVWKALNNSSNNLTDSDKNSWCITSYIKYLVHWRGVSHSMAWRTVNSLIFTPLLAIIMSSWEKHTNNIIHNHNVSWKCYARSYLLFFSFQTLLMRNIVLLPTHTRIFIN